MYITSDIYWVLIPTIGIHFSGSKTVNYSAHVKLTWFRWTLHIHWYEGNDNKAPF